jgi:serine/threonine-protein kinase
VNGISAGLQITPSLTLVRPVGAGGMGSVWLAQHTGLRSIVVVKFLSEELARNTDALDRFSREAAAASQVKSPHVVHMIDHGIATNGAPFIAMEYLEGHDLRRRLEREQKLPPRQIAHILVQAAKALTRAHERGVVHRDIKPENIFLSDGGGGEAFVKVLDFGIAKVEDPSRQLSQTKTGATIGTPFYMSPEQTLGSKSIDFRTDLWSLGVVGMEAASGRRPFNAETIGALAVAICNGPLPVPTQLDPTLPSGLDAWFARACAREPGERFGSATELAEAFAAAVGGTESVPFQVEPGSSLALAATELLEPPGRSETPALRSSPSTLGAVSESGPPHARSWATRLVFPAVFALATAVAVGVAVTRGGTKSVSQLPATAPPQPVPSTNAETPPKSRPGLPVGESLTPPPPLLPPSLAVSSSPSAPAMSAPAATPHRASPSVHPPATIADPFGNSRR